MKIKKVLVSSIQEGMQIITRELGEDAIILSTRNISPDSSENENRIEIIAAIDDSFSIENKLSHYEHKQNGKTKFATNDDTTDPLILPDGLKNQISEIRNLLFELSHRVKYKLDNNLNGDVRFIFEQLIKSDFSEEFSYKVIDELLNKLSDKAEKTKDLNYIKNLTRDILLKDIKFLPPLTKGDNCTIMSFFGTTGSGKTTTLIKLAILFKIIFNADSVILSTDVNRVGAVEQLQTYSSIAAIQHYPIFTPEDLAVAIEDNKNKDFIFVDTTGCSQQDSELLNEIRIYLDIIGEHHKFLIQSCNIGKTTFRQILKEYSKLEATGIILTKFDEAATVGNIIEVLNEEKYPISYFTNGVRVPDDIEPANIDFLKKFALP